MKLRESGNVPTATVATVNERRTRRSGTVVQSLRAIEGSSEVAMETAAAPPPMAVVAIATFVPARHRDLATIA